MREGDVAIGTQEVNGVAPQAGTVDFGMPGKGVEWQLSLTTQFLDL
jgi:hypothetical protein